MLERLRTFIHTHKLLSPEDTLILAVSGGLDSMVMLDLFLRLDLLNESKPAVVHVNHGLRGAESDADEKLVRDYCSERGLFYYSEHLKDLPENASEDTMRQARYAAFEKILALKPEAKLATAHHLDDQLETFLMRLAKGSSLKGLGSIPEKRGAFIRPMLSFRRTELEKYAQENSIPYRIDATNQNISKLRNHVRKNIVPKMIEVFGEGLYKGFNKTLSELKIRQKILTEENARKFGKFFKIEQESGYLPLEHYLALPALQRRDLFHYCISKLNLLNYLAINDSWKSFDKFAQFAKTGSRFIISANIKVLKNRTALVFSTSSDEQRPAKELFPESSIHWGNFLIQLDQVTNSEVEFQSDPNREFFCGDKVTFPLQVRAWKNGDVFRPIGMKGLKKLSDFFIDSKVDRDKKKCIPIITSGSAIIWVSGYRLDERFKVTKQSQTFFKISLTEEA